MYDEGLLIAWLFLGLPFIVWGTLKLRDGEAKLVPGLQALGLPDATFLRVSDRIVRVGRRRGDRHRLSGADRERSLGSLVSRYGL